MVAALQADVVWVNDYRVTSPTRFCRISPLLPRIRLTWRPVIGWAGQDTENEGDEIPEGNHSAVHSLVCGVRSQLSQPRGNDARARGVGRSFDNQSLGSPFSTLAGQDIPSAQAVSGRKLEDGRDVYQGMWSVEDLYRAVDKEWNAIDFLLSAKRDTAAATRFFEKAMRQNGDPEKITMDKNRVNKAAIDGINEGRDLPIEVCQIKYLNNIVEQDHRAVKPITKSMLGFKSLRAASKVLSGIGLMHMIRKGQMIVTKGEKLSFAHQFYALAG
jgi:hypothetical protein